MRRAPLHVFYVPADEESPGHILVTVVAPPRLRGGIGRALRAKPPRIGLRHYGGGPRALRREIVTVETSLGPVTSSLGATVIVNAVPEFEDCAALSRTHHVSVKEVQDAGAAGLRESRNARHPL